MRNKMKIILSLICVLLLGSILVVRFIKVKENNNNNNNNKPVQEDAEKFKKEYESLNNTKNPNNKKTYPKVSISKNNMVKYSSYDEVLKILKNGTGVIYLGYPECPWCRNAVPVLVNALSDAGVENLYYINMHDERDSYELVDGKVVLKDKGTSGYQKLLKALDSILDDYILKDEDGKEYEVGEKRIYVPTVVFVKDGKIVAYHNDTVESQEDPYVLLDDKQQNELYGIYTKKIHIMLDDLCDERC